MSLYFLFIGRELCDDDDSGALSDALLLAREEPSLDSLELYRPDPSGDTVAFCVEFFENRGLGLTFSLSELEGRELSV